MWRESKGNCARCRHGHGRGRCDDGKEADRGEGIDILLTIEDDEAM